MPLHRVRFTIGQIMAAVAASAAAMALVGPRFAPDLLAILLVPAAIFVEARRRGVARCRILAWLLVAYPVVLLASHYLSWAIACEILGHRPGSAPGDRLWRPGFPVVDLQGIAALLLVVSTPAALLCIGLVFAEFVGAKDAPAGPTPDGLAVSAITSWFFLFLLVTTDPGRSFAWFLD